MDGTNILLECPLKPCSHPRPQALAQALGTGGATGQAVAQATAEAYTKQPAPVANTLADAITAANNNSTQVGRAL